MCQLCRASVTSRVLRSFLSDQPTTQPSLQSGSDHYGQVDETCPTFGTYVMSATHESVGAADLEVSLHQIRSRTAVQCASQEFVRVLRLRLTPSMPATLHQSVCHPVFAHQVTFRSKFRRNAGSSIGPDDFAGGSR